MQINSGVMQPLYKGRGREEGAGRVRGGWERGGEGERGSDMGKGGGGLTAAPWVVPMYAAVAYSPAKCRGPTGLQHTTWCARCPRSYSHHEVVML
jgi:hypothetical protein